MICKNCQIAGDMVAVARNFSDKTAVLNIQNTSVYSREAVRSVAHLYHGLCTDCDCQHKIDFEGKALQDLTKWPIQQA